MGHGCGDGGVPLLADNRLQAQKGAEDCEQIWGMPVIWPAFSKRLHLGLCLLPGISFT